MTIGIIGVSLLFLIIAFAVTEKNAKYLLAGYNTMSNEDRSKMDLKSYLTYFRKFHVFLSLSFLSIGLVLNLISENAAGVFFGVYPVLGYIYFIWSSKHS